MRGFLFVGFRIGKLQEFQNREKSVPTHYLEAENFSPATKYIA